MKAFSLSGFASLLLLFVFVHSEEAGRAATIIDPSGAGNFVGYTDRTYNAGSATSLGGGWTYNSGTYGSITIAASNDPWVTSVTGAQMVSYTDGDGTSSAPSLNNGFTTLSSGSYGLSFDFQEDSSADNYTFQLGSVTLLDFGRAGVGTVQAVNGGTYTTVTSSSLTASDWYRVILTLNVGTSDTFSGEILNTSDTVVATFSNYTITGSTLNGIAIADNTPTGSGGTLGFDNFSIATVPEPPPMYLFLLALIGFAGLARWKARTARLAA